MNTDNITEITYKSLQSAFDYFNTELFDGKLSNVLITLNRKKGKYGYFSANRFVDKTDTSMALTTTKSEIALNPDTFGRSDIEILATLVHEMVHHWQHEHGSPGFTKGYHNGQWALKMKTVGLQPIGDKTGFKGTGINVSHEIERHEKFEQKAIVFLATNKDFNLNYASKHIGGYVKKSYTRHSFRYECPKCDMWAKAPKNKNIVCGNCLETMNNIDTESF